MVYFTSCDVVVPVKGNIIKTLVVSQIKIDLRGLNRDIRKLVKPTLTVVHGGRNQAANDGVARVHVVEAKHESPAV